MARKDQENLAVRAFRLGLFGDTRSGKTVLLSSLQWMAEEGALPAGHNLRPDGPETARYLGERVAMMRAGQWPAGTVANTELRLLLDTPKLTLSIKTVDFRGGDFGKAFFDGNSAEAERFVRTLFADTSAYVFLVAPEKVQQAIQDDSDSEDQAERERATVSVVAAMESLRKKAFGFRFCHRPVAIVFTKCDQHPEVAADPEAYARKYLRQTHEYLRTQAGGKHKFFACSSTGGIATEGGPPAQLRPSGLVEPFLWCAAQHRKRSRTLKAWTLAVAATILLVAYTLLYYCNSRSIRGLQDSLTSRNGEQLVAAYQEARSMDFPSWTFLTHPYGGIQLRKQIVAAAGDLLEKDIHPRKDADGRLRTVEDFLQVERLVHVFGQRFPGTDEAQTLGVYLADQRRHLSCQVAGEAKLAASSGNEPKFLEAISRYSTVATPEGDKIIDDAKKIIAIVLAMEKAKQIYFTRQTKPTDVSAIRKDCKDAENQIAGKPTDRKVIEYVETVRILYDDLNSNPDLEVRLMEIHSDNDNNVLWTAKPLTCGGAEVKERTSGDWVGLTENKLSINEPLTVRFWETPSIQVVVHEDRWAPQPNGKGFVEIPLKDIAKRSVDNWELTTDQGRKFRILMTPSERLVKLWNLLEQVEKLEDELFRKKAS